MAAGIAVIGVVGAGQMGSGIAQLAATSGFQVRLYDSNSAAVDRAAEVISAAVSRLVVKGYLSQQLEGTDAINRLMYTKSLGDLSPADIIIEAIVESEDAKKKLFWELHNIAQDSAILASNTSSISITRLASATWRPSQHMKSLRPLHVFAKALCYHAIGHPTYMNYLAIRKQSGLNFLIYS